MNYFWHDSRVLTGTVAIDVLILITWQVLASSLYSRENEGVADVVGAGTALEAAPPPLLHRITGWACGFLLVGLLVESTALFLVIVVRFGFSR